MVFVEIMKWKMEMMDKWKLFLNKEVKLIYEDSGNHFSKKEGRVIQITDTHIIILINELNEAINLSKVLRIEEKREMGR